MPDLSSKLAIVTGTGRSPDTFPDDDKAMGSRDIASGDDEIRTMGRQHVTSRSHRQTVRRVGHAPDQRQHRLPRHHRHITLGQQTRQHPHRPRRLGAPRDEHPHGPARYRNRRRQHHRLPLLRPSPLDQRPIHQYRRRPSLLPLTATTSAGPLCQKHTAHTRRKSADNYSSTLRSFPRKRETRIHNARHFRAAPQITDVSAEKQLS